MGLHLLLNKFRINSWLSQTTQKSSVCVTCMCVRVRACMCVCLCVFLCMHICMQAEQSTHFSGGAIVSYSQFVVVNMLTHT